MNQDGAESGSYQYRAQFFSLPTEPSSYPCRHAPNQQQPTQNTLQFSHQPTTSIPIDRAVPFTLFTAASSDAAFRSGIFCLAMSSTCLSVTLPTLSLFGAPDPLAMPAALFKRIDAGGVFVMKVNERSL